MLGQPKSRLFAAVAVVLAGMSCASSEGGRRPRAQASPEHEDVHLFRFALRAPLGLSPTNMVPLQAAITEPDGGEVRVLGFADGALLRLRYRPRKAGEHRYLIRVMDGGRE